MESRHQSSSLLNNDNYQEQQATKSKKSLSNKQQFERNYRKFCSANKNIKATNYTQYSNLTPIRSKYQKTFSENDEENNEYRSYLDEKKDNHISNNNTTRKPSLSTVFLKKELTSIKSVQDVDNKNNKHSSLKINHHQSQSSLSFQNFNVLNNDKHYHQKHSEDWIFDSNKWKNNANDNNESRTLLEWVENELDRHGIDQVIFGRIILGLLQQCSNNNITYLDDNSNYESTDTDSGYNSITTNNNKFIDRYQIIRNKRSNTNFRYCETHRENKIGFYNNQGKYSFFSPSLVNQRPKDNTQKPPSTTKWMHKRYLQQSNNYNNDNFEDNFIFDDQCPECQYQRQKQVKDERKFMLVQCLKSASDKYLSDEIETFVEQLCLKYDQLNKNNRYSNLGSSNIINPSLLIEDNHVADANEFDVQKYSKNAKKTLPDKQQFFYSSNDYDQKYNGTNSDTIETIKNQAKKYYDAFPALGSLSSSNNSPVTLKSNKLDCSSSPSNSTSHQSLSDDSSIFYSETVASIPKFNFDSDKNQDYSEKQTLNSSTNTWNGKKIIKNISRQNLNQINLSTASKDNCSSILSLKKNNEGQISNNSNNKPNVVKLKSSLINGKSYRNGLIVAPPSLNFSTDNLINVGSSGSSTTKESLTTLVMLKNNKLNTTSNDNYQTDNILNDNNLILKDNLTVSEVETGNTNTSNYNNDINVIGGHSTLSAHEFEKISQIMPSFLNGKLNATNSTCTDTISTKVKLSSENCSKTNNSNRYPDCSINEPQNSNKILNIKNSGNHTGDIKNALVNSKISTNDGLVKNIFNVRNNDSSVELLPKFLKCKLSSTSKNSECLGSEKSLNQYNNLDLFFNGNKKNLKLSSMNIDSFGFNLSPKNDRYPKENVNKISQESNENITELLKFNDLIEAKNVLPNSPDNFFFKDHFKTLKNIEELKKMFDEASFIEDDKKRIEYFLNIWNENSTLGYMNKIHSMNCSSIDNEEFKMSLVSELALITNFVNKIKNVNHENANNQITDCELSIDSIFSSNQEQLNLTRPSMGILNNFDCNLSDEQSKFEFNNFINTNGLIGDTELSSINMNSPVDLNFTKNKEITEQSNIETKPDNLSMPYSKRYKNKLKLSKNINDDPILFEFPTRKFYHSFPENNENCDNINDGFNYDNLPNTEILDEWISSLEHINHKDRELNQIFQNDNTKTEMNLKTYGNDLYDFDGYLINIPKSTISTSNEYSTLNSATTTLSNINCTSIYDDIDIKFKLENRTLIPDNDAKPLQKPCIFYLDKACARVDCKFSHNISSIPCKYYLEGACYKQEFCPFLHDQPNRKPDMDSLLSNLDPNAESFQFKIESDSDFPSLNNFLKQNNSTNNTEIESRVNFILKNKSTNSGSNEFEQPILALSSNSKGESTKCSEEMIKFPSLNSKNGKNFAQSFNKSATSDFAPENFIASKEEWPSLPVGEETKPKSNSIQQSQTQSKSTNKYVTTKIVSMRHNFSNVGSINFRDKVLMKSIVVNHKTNKNTGQTSSDSASESTNKIGTISLKSILNNT